MTEARHNHEHAWKLVAAGLGAALIVSLVVLAAVWRGTGQTRQEQAAETEALDAARNHAVAITTYDHRQLDKDFSWVNDGATKSFAKEYRAANEPLRKVIEKLKATANGRVTEAAATAESAEEVRVLLFIDQTITNESKKEPTSDRSRVVMKMVKRDGSWLVDDVELR